MRFDEEVRLIRAALGMRKAEEIGRMIVEMDTLPHKTCALAMYPKILVDKSLFQYDSKKRAFIILHEYLHLQGKHGETIARLIRSKDIEEYSPRHREAMAMWAVEIWTNIKVYMLLGFKPDDMSFDDGDLRFVSTARDLQLKGFCRMKFSQWKNDDETVRRIASMVHSCYCGSNTQEAEPCSLKLPRKSKTS